MPDQKLRQFVAEVRSLNAVDLSRMTEAKRLSHIAALLCWRAAATLDFAPSRKQTTPSKGKRAR